MTKVNYNGESRDMTTEEQAQYDKDQLAWNNKSTERKLSEIKRIRLQKLEDTDWKVTSAKEQSTNLSTSFKTWRQNLRNIPEDYDSSKYDELLARDSDGNLTHSVWSE
jgi:hypothetical protein